MRKLTGITLGWLALIATPAEATHLNVTATLGDLAAITAEVAGSHATVRSLVPPTVDPHYVDPRPSLIVILSKTDLLVVNGLDLEEAWLRPLCNNSRNSKIQPGSSGRLNVANSVPRLGMPSGRVDRSMGDIHPGGNPHFTFDPRRAKAIAAVIAQRLGELDPEHDAAFKANLAAFERTLDEVATTQRARFAQIPAAKRRVVAYHQSLVYLLDWLAIEQIATLEPKPGIPPTPGHVAQVLRLMRTRDTRVVVQEDYYPSGASKTLARLAKGKLAVIPAATRFEAGQTYVDHLKEVTDAIYAAMAE